jgi:hypothetical protein
MADPIDPIDRCLERWHAFMRAGDPALLDDLLADDCVFLSPIVFTPQRGKDVTKLYLTAAGATLGGGGGKGERAERAAEPADGEWDGRFRYVRDVRQGHDAVLEFETTLGGKYVNGVDLITCDEGGRIVAFKVMVRPLQAVNAVHEQMKAALERMSSAPG